MLTQTTNLKILGPTRSLMPKISVNIVPIKKRNSNRLAANNTLIHKLGAEYIVTSL